MSYFLLDLKRIQSSEFHVRLSEGVDQSINNFPKERVFFEGNMANISTTIPINISTKPDVMENVYIGGISSPEEIATYKYLFKELCDVFT